MADIFEYLDWRADVPFSVAPFNEVDNLILSELAYTDFSGVVPESFRKVPLSSACEQFFRTHSEEELLRSTSFTAKAPLLMQHMLTGRRFGRMCLSHHINHLDAEKTAQLSATTFLLDDRTAYVAFRGTDSTLVGWKEDFDIGWLSETTGQQLAVAYLEQVASRVRSPLRVGGHSKGGNFAVFASAFCSSQTQDRILSVYCNDGPGYRDEIVRQPGYQRILPRMIRIVPDTSMIGMLLSTQAACNVVRSSASGILQHDGFTWQVRRDQFESAELSETGKILDRVLDSWIDGMDDLTRKSVTDTIFSAFEATGADTFHEMSQQKWKAAESILGYIFSAPREKQSELFRLAAELIKSGSQAAIAQLPELFLSKKDGHQDGKPLHPAERSQMTIAEHDNKTFPDETAQMKNSS